MTMSPNLEIVSVWDYYDAPLCGSARLGDRRLYYFWIDDVPIERDGRSFKVRHYTAYDIDDETWAFLERDRELDDAFDADVDPTPEELERWDHVGQLHTRLLETDGVVSFTSSSVPFPCYV